MSPRPANADATVGKLSVPTGETLCYMRHPGFASALIPVFVWECPQAVPIADGLVVVLGCAFADPVGSSSH